MSGKIKLLFNLLTTRQRRNFFLLQIFVILMAFMEIIGVASIIPFMTLVGDISMLQEDTFISQIYQNSGISSKSHFIFLLGIFVLIMLFVSAIISMFTIWRLSMFANKIGMEIADRLYIHYLRQNWLFHTSVSSAQLTKKIATEALRLTNQVLVPIMQMNARIALAFFMSLCIFLYNPSVALSGLVVFGFAYFFLFKVVKKRLQNNGENISKVNNHRFRLMNDGFGGIRDVLLQGRDKEFIKRFKETGRILAYSEGNNDALTLVPRYFMELVAFGTMIALVLYLIATHDGNLGMILPIFSVYALATFKLLPAFQQIYANLAIIKGNIAAFSNIQKDLMNSMKDQQTKINDEKNYLSINEKISFEDITFTYPGKTKETLTNINISIPSKNIVGIVGPSGSGKSTLIDILIGLIEPDHGQLKIDNIKINNQNLRKWQNNIGFVSQSIFLSEGTIAENVAFGIPDDQINIENIHRALELANLQDFIQSLENGVDTIVGERGVQLSGGQRQRIGIARALYFKPEVLVFDEATSSLDGITEKMIMNAIHKFTGQKTIILIAHRLKTVEKCDQIFFIDKGKLVDQGTFQELIEKNEKFKKLASIS